MTIRNGRVKRRMGAVLLAGLVGSLLAFASPSAALINDEAGTARFGGDNRYETAAAIATSPHWAIESSSTPDVVVVNGENFPDGLAASVYGDRILLVKQNSIPAATEEAIIALQNLGSGQVDLEVVGGPAAVSAEVVGQLIDITNGDGGYVDFNGRHYGANRYETAIAVAEDYDGGSHSCLTLAVGDNFPDALAAGQLVYDFECPLVLTAGDSLHPATKAYMAAETASDLDFVYVIGGTAAIPASVENELFAMGINTMRLGGANRAETAAAIADEVGYNRSAVLVNGNGFADALAASTFATLSAVDGALLLVNSDSIPPATAAWHVENCGTLGEDTDEDLPDDGDPETDENVYGTVFAIGGTAVISDDVLAGAGAATKCGDPIDLVSVTIAVSDITEQICAVEDVNTGGGGFAAGDGEWVAGSTAPTLIPVAGGAASGLDPLVTSVTISGVDEGPVDGQF
ncbi:MAG: cell wall-binding repeat-containing protein, partial [Ilumatobacteraceae bacterium]